MINIWIIKGKSNNFACIESQEKTRYIQNIYFRLNMCIYTAKDFMAY